jgi:hypothetical protein
MPFVSQAQRKKFYAMEDSGEIPKGTSEEWEAHTPASIPKRLGRPTPPPPKSKRKPVPK